jgi:Spy/CpxP family protein refolding chaperone
LFIGCAGGGASLRNWQSTAFPLNIDPEQIPATGVTVNSSTLSLLLTDEVIPMTTLLKTTDVSRFKTRALVFSAAILVAAAMNLRAADAPPTSPAPPHAGMMADMNLSVAQRAAFRNAMKQLHETLRSQRDMHEQLRDMAQSDNYDAAKVRDLVHSQQTQNENNMVSSSTAMHDFYAMLTPDQKARLAEHRKQMREQMKSRMTEHMKDRADDAGDDDLPDEGQ